VTPCGNAEHPRLSEACGDCQFWHGIDACVDPPDATSPSLLPQQSVPGVPMVPPGGTLTCSPWVPNSTDLPPCPKETP
jgi:hypothetical protein